VGAGPADVLQRSVEGRIVRIEQELDQVAEVVAEVEEIQRQRVVEQPLADADVPSAASLRQQIRIPHKRIEQVGDRRCAEPGPQLIEMIIG